MHESRTPTISTRAILAYMGMIALSIITFFAVRSLADFLALAPLVGSPSRVASGAGQHDLLNVLFALVVVIVVSRLLGQLLERVHQPAVIGEVLAGVMLGPSLLGKLFPEATSLLFPSRIIPFLGILAQVGIIVFMFLVGIDLDTSLLRKRGHAAAAISHASILAPFTLGTVLALWLYPSLCPAGVEFHAFALFMGVAMSITAFPVLARILTDRGMHRTRLGVLALSCAAVDDATAWCLLAFVIGIVNAQAGSGLLTIGLAIVFVTFMVLVVRPRVERATRAQEMRGTVSRTESTLTLIGILVSALIAEYIGIHAVLGAFLAGVVIPHESRLASVMKQKLEDISVIVLLPAFFAFTGLRTEIGLVHGTQAWLMCGAIILVACAGKLGGSYVAARFAGVDRHQAASLGILMNTRGLMELVVLNIGLDLGVISLPLFAMMVLMALATTLAASPLLSLIGTPFSAPKGAVPEP